MARKKKIVKLDDNTDKSIIDDLLVESLDRSFDRDLTRALKREVAIPKRSKPFSTTEGHACLRTMSTKGLMASDIIASNPIANCKEDYEAWINAHI